MSSILANPNRQAVRQLEFAGDPLFVRLEDAGTSPVNGELTGLSAGVRELLEGLGYDGLMRLLDAYAGELIYVPREVTADHALAQALGLETAQALCRTVGCSGGFRVPTGHDLRRKLRDREIRAQRAAGLSLRALVRRFKLSECRICAVLAQEDR